MNEKHKYLFGLLLLSSFAVICAVVTSLPVRSRYATIPNDSVAADGEVVALDSFNDDLASIGPGLELTDQVEPTVSGSPPSTTSSNLVKEPTQVSNLNQDPDPTPVLEPGLGSEIDPISESPSNVPNPPLATEPTVATPPKPQLETEFVEQDRKSPPGAEVAAENSQAYLHRSERSKEIIAAKSNGAAPRLLGVHTESELWKDMVRMLMESLLARL